MPLNVITCCLYCLWHHQLVLNPFHYHLSQFSQVTDWKRTMLISWRNCLLAVERLVWHNTQTTGFVKFCTQTDMLTSHAHMVLWSEPIIIIVVVIFRTLGTYIIPREFKKIVKRYKFGYDHQSVQSIAGKLPRRRTALTRYTKIEILWYRNLVSRASPEHRHLLTNLF